jgi:hypothetical protein
LCHNFPFKISPKIYGKIQTTREIFLKHMRKNMASTHSILKTGTLTHKKKYCLYRYLLSCAVSIYHINLLVQGGSKILSYHSGCMAHALIELFPNIGLEKQRFPSTFFFPFQLIIFPHLFFYVCKVCGKMKEAERNFLKIMQKNTDLTHSTQSTGSDNLVKKYYHYRYSFVIDYI